MAIEKTVTLNLKLDEQKSCSVQPVDAATKSVSALDISLHRLGLDDASTVHRFWLFIIGLSATFDFMATVVADYVPDQRSQAGVDTDPWIVNVVQFLDIYSIPLSILFSMLWFADAFVKAREERDKKLKALDRKRLFGEVDGTSTEEVTELKGAWGAYYRTCLFQLLLLPVGFYVLIWHTFRVSLQTRDFLAEDDEIIEIHFYGGKGTNDDQVYTTHTSHSALFAVIRLSAAYVSQVTGVRLKAKITALGVNLSKRLAFFAVRRPKRFMSRLRKCMTALRWIKYLAPLIGTGNKLRENVEDLFKKYRQRRHAFIALRLRKQVWKQKQGFNDPKSLQEAAAIRVQSVYRAKRAKSAIKALNMIRSTREDAAATRLQKVLRTRLVRARSRIQLKKQELVNLQKRQKVMAQGNGMMDDESRRRLYQLQDELKLEAQELLNRKLLLRPNTTFAVAWKVLFVVCVFFEIGQLAFSPKLTKLVDKKTGQPMNIGEVLHTKFVPKLISDSCSDLQTIEAREFKGPKIFRFFQQKMRPTRRKINAEHKPWFCDAPYSTARATYVRGLHFVVTEFLLIVGIVCFLDVFVTFFTGELSDENGALIPKPFMKRWILPGIVLQLLVNPQMETTCKWLFRALSNAAHFGPARVWRWAAALFFPVFRLLVYVVERYLWTPLVKKENHHPVTLNTKTPIEQQKLARAYSKKFKIE
jgi:hypothetical protein